MYIRTRHALAVGVLDAGKPANFQYLIGCSRKEAMQDYKSNVLITSHFIIEQIRIPLSFTTKEHKTATFRRKNVNNYFNIDRGILARKKYYSSDKYKK